MTLEVVEPGLLTTVQDAGRPDWTHLGVPVGGACDPWSLAVANLLAGADAGAAALEMTIAGPTLAVRATTIIGLAGADLGGVVRETGRRLLPGRLVRARGGLDDRVPGGGRRRRARARTSRCRAGSTSRPSSGRGRRCSARGSAGSTGGRSAPATSLKCGGRRRRGRRPGSAPGRGSTATRSPRAGEPLRVVAGPAAGVEEIVGRAWRVGPDSDRIGLRLETDDDAPTPSGTGMAAGSGELLSHGVVHGAIQLPPGGAPLVLLADHQTTGGYPVAAVVARADHPRLGQLRPGEVVRFVAVGPDEARRRVRRAGPRARPGAAALRGDDAWDELWRSAGR